MENGGAHPRRASVPSRASLRGLDWFTFFVADIQTGFGPFLAIYLTTQKWTQADIGLILSFGSIAGLLSQLPGGWLVDRVPSKRRAALIAVIGIGASALLIALVPSFLGIALAKLLHVVSSAILGPAIAAITLGLTGALALAPRLGRNASFASVGNAVAAGAMGACGTFLSPQAVFFVTALLAVPTLVALSQIRAGEIDPIRADGGKAPGPGDGQRSTLGLLLRRKTLWVFSGALLLFHAANAAMLPLVGVEMTVRAGAWSSVLVAICIIVPQLVVSVLAPWVGHFAVRGRRPLLLIGFAALPVRATLLGLSTEPALVVAVQALDGACAAVLGVLVPLFAL